MSISRNISFVSNYLLLWRYTKEISRRLIEFNAQSPTEDNLNQHSQQRNRITFYDCFQSRILSSHFFNTFFQQNLNPSTTTCSQLARSKIFTKKQKMPRKKSTGKKIMASNIKNSLCRSVQAEL